MTAVEVGAYIRLLCFAWGNGFIPSDSCALKRIAGVTVSESVLSKFTDGKNGRMEEERNKQAVWRDKSRIGGLHSAAKRGSTTLQPPLQPNGNQPCLQPNGNTPSPSPSPEERESAPPQFAEHPTWEEWWKYCQSPQCSLMAEFYAKDKFLAAEADNWKGKTNWQAYARRCQAWWRADGAPKQQQQRNNQPEQHKPMSKMTSAEMLSEAMR